MSVELTVFPRVRLADLLYNCWRIFPVPVAALAASTYTFLIYIIILQIAETYFGIFFLHKRFISETYLLTLKKFWNAADKLDYLYTIFLLVAS